MSVKIVHTAGWIAIALVSVAACSQSASTSSGPTPYVAPTTATQTAGSPSPSNAASTSATSTWSAEQQQVADVGVRFLTAVTDILVGAPADPAVLERFATPDFALKTAQTMATQTMSGVTGTGTVTYTPMSATVTGTTARLVVCSDSRKLTFHVAGPAPSTVAATSPTTTVVLLDQAGGRWLVTGRGDKSQGAGAPCGA